LDTEADLHPLAFVAELLARADPAKAARKKNLEERIAVPFSLMERQKTEQRS